MATRFGVHTNAQNKSISDLMSIWRLAEDLGFDWISISDHFAGAMGPGSSSNEAVSTHAALATTTRRVECGVLVYAVPFRHPAVLAGAAATIDHISGGRAAIGLGAGSVETEFKTYGFPFSDTSRRMDALDEAVQCVAGLLHEEAFSFHGQYYSINEAQQLPRPARDRVPVIVGTGGEARGLRIVARHADGWNCAFPSPEAFSRKHAALAKHCAEVGRDLGSIRCSVNLFLATGQYPPVVPPSVQPGAVTGSAQEAVDRIGRYVDAGADQVNFFLSYPWDRDSLAELAEVLELGASSEAS